MSDPARLAEIRAHLARVTQHGALSKDQLRSDEYLGELIGEVEWLRGLLTHLEWAGGIETGPGSGCVPCCPWCEVEQADPHGHGPGCELAAALRPERETTPHP